MSIYMENIIRQAQRRQYILIALLAITVRLFVVIFADLYMNMLARGFTTPAGGEFVAMAQGLVNGNGFTYAVVQGTPAPSAYQPPFYPLILAGVFTTLGMGVQALLFLQLLQVVIGGATAILVYVLALKILGQKEAIISSLLFSVYPPLAYLPVEVHSISFYICLSLLFLVYAYNSAHSPSPSNYVVMGVAGGMLALIRSEALFLVLIAYIAVRAFYPQSKSPWFFLSLVAVVLCVTPWIVRNYIVFRRPVLTTTVWFNLWRGQGESSSGAAYHLDGTPVWWTQEIREDVRSLPWSQDYELNVEDIYKRHLFSYVKDHPLHPLELVPAKLFYFWGVDITHPKARIPLYWMSWLALIPFYVRGVSLFTRKWRRDYTFVFLWPVYYTFIVLLFFVLPRYRLFIDSFVLLISSRGVADTYNSIMRRREI